ncbi:MAG: hypothetical protein M1816_000950 [Peltula sp. TS41687]|nr:MAG: hypothetical protein M1816_000950 [Peltula sp. TS41687]
MLEQEYFSRPTEPAGFWPPPHSHVLGGRDLLRSEHGTWLGITRQGRLAVLTNFREDAQNTAHPIQGARSRGAMVNAWLKLPPNSEETTEAFVERLFQEDNLKGIGGFSLLCGHLKKSKSGATQPLAVVSNRTPDVGAVHWIAGSPGDIHGLSNSAYGDPWPKVTMGMTLLRTAIEESIEVKDTENGLVERFFNLLSVNTLPASKKGDSLEAYMRKLRESIFIPPLGGSGASRLPAEDLAAARGVERREVVDLDASKKVEDMKPIYGTQKQTVVLVNTKGVVTFVERTLFDNDGNPVAVGRQDRGYQFTIDASDHW